MSADYYGCTGHVLRLTDEVIETLGITKKKLYDAFPDNVEEWMGGQLQAEYNINEILDHLANDRNTITIEIGNLQTKVMIFRCDEDGRSNYDEITPGLYLEFDESDLYIKRDTEFNKALKDKNINVPFCTWVEWG